MRWCTQPIKMRAERANYCVAKNATLRAARLDPSAGKERVPQDDIAFFRIGGCDGRD